MIFNYPKISQNLIIDLPPRVRDIVERRFGLKNGKRETLEAIGQDYGITRERVRQIEENGFSKIKPRLAKMENIFQYFIKEIKENGDLKKEDILLPYLGRKRFNVHIYFLLTLGERFERFNEDEDLYSLWTIDKSSLDKEEKVIDGLVEKLAEVNRPMLFDEIVDDFGEEIKEETKIILNPKIILSYIEVTKK